MPSGGYNVYLRRPITEGWGGGIPGAADPDERLHYRCTQQGSRDGTSIVLVPQRGVAYTTNDLAPQFGTSTWTLRADPARYVLTVGPVWMAIDRTSGRFSSSTAGPNSPILMCVRVAGH